MNHERRKELLAQYKEIKIYMGVVKITNIQSGKIYIHAYPNLKNKWLTIKYQLEMGQFFNVGLQKDYNEIGPDFFTFEILEEKPIDDVTDMKWELSQMEKPWLLKLQPFDEAGYNRRPLNYD